MSDQKPFNLSRRGLLKALGITLIGSATGTLAIPAHVALAATARDASEAWAIAATSPLFALALERTKPFLFEFVLEASSFQVVGEQTNYVGLWLRQMKSPSRRTGVDLICTVDMQQRDLLAVQVIIGWALDDLLEVQSSLFDRQSLEPIRLVGRDVQVVTFPVLGEFSWSFPRYTPEEADAQLPQEKPGEKPGEQPPRPVPTEWPPDSADPRFFFYEGCSLIEWSETPVPLFLGRQVREVNAADATQQRLLDLSYARTPEADLV